MCTRRSTSLAPSFSERLGGGSCATRRCPPSSSGSRRWTASTWTRRCSTRRWRQDSLGRSRRAPSAQPPACGSASARIHDRGRDPGVEQVVRRGGGVLEHVVKPRGVVRLRSLDGVECGGHSTGTRDGRDPGCVNSITVSPRRDRFRQPGQVRGASWASTEAASPLSRRRWGCADVVLPAAGLQDVVHGPVRDLLPVVGADFHRVAEVVADVDARDGVLLCRLEKLVKLRSVGAGSAHVCPLGSV